MDGEEFPIKESICVNVKPAGCRGLENTGCSERSDEKR